MEIYDVVVIGGGPAGMMAAGRAAELLSAKSGSGKVLLIEKNDTLGRKLLITGGGRCNVTNAEFDNRTLLAKFKDADKFLFSAFSQWSVKETLDFFHARQMPTKTEAEKRVFPDSNTAQSVWTVLVEHMQKHGVAVISDSPVVGFVKKADAMVGAETEAGASEIEAVKLKNGREIRAHSFVLATGGKSRPETGSTGDGFTWLKELGHSVSEPTAALVPIAIKDSWISKLAGIALPNIKLTLFQNKVKQDSRKGKILFTHVGVSGPTVLNMSQDIGELLKYGEVVISLDLLPALDYGQLNEKLQEIFAKHHGKKIKNSLGDLVLSAIVPVILEKAGISPDTECNSVTREARLALVQILKGLEMQVKSLLGVEKAVVTSGGVSLAEIDFKTMRSRKIANLFVVGDLLDIDRPSGGYSLQLCWTTGYVAGTHSAKKTSI